MKTKTLKELQAAHRASKPRSSGVPVALYRTVDRETARVKKHMGELVAEGYYEKPLTLSRVFTHESKMRDFLAQKTDAQGRSIYRSHQYAHGVGRGYWLNMNTGRIDYRYEPVRIE